MSELFISIGAFIIVAAMTSKINHAIPEDWIKRYVDQLLNVANSLQEDSAMQQAVLLRADHALDLVKAWRQSKND